MAAVAPVHLTGFAALRWGGRFALDPLAATRRCNAELGPFVVLSDAIRFARPRGVAILGVPLVLMAGAQFQRELLSDPATWRGVSLMPGGPRHSAARRMKAGINRMTGHHHAHYRKLIAPALHKSNVRALTASMARLAEAEVASWPTGQPVDLWDRLTRLVRGMALQLLFGGDDEQTLQIADLAGRVMKAKWGRRGFIPINLPITVYGHMVRDAAQLERAILAWIRSKRGNLDKGDIASVIVNSPDADGNVPEDAAVAGQMPSLIASSSEASHSVLMWTLFFLIQHPRAASEVLAELRQHLGTTSPSLDHAGELPYLDAVLNESMRILPPVPMQMRVAQRDTAIADYPVPVGTRAALNVFLTNRTPEIYPDGGVFSPERWLKISPTAFEFPVFSAGPHSCPGYSFGSISVKIAIAAIMSRYRITLANDTRVDYRLQPTMRPARPVPVVLHRQDGAFAATLFTGNIRSLIEFPQ